MGTLTASMLLPSKLKPSVFEDQSSVYFKRSCRGLPKLNKAKSFSPVMRLFGPAIFEASKLKVLFLGVDKEKHPGKLPRTYTLTHSDITSKLTLAISQTINNSQLQGWYNQLQRDEVVAEWKKVKGKMSLHVHCHISGGHFLLDLFAKLRFYIFCKELPVVLKAFVHGDENLFNNYPELQEAMVWVYFHSNLEEFNKIECWGPLKDAVARNSKKNKNKNKIDFKLSFKEEDDSPDNELEIPETCKEPCTCCFPPTSVIPWSHSALSQGDDLHLSGGTHQGLEQQQQT